MKDKKTLSQAIKAGMHYSESLQCPECGCPWYGNKNDVGEGHRTCFNCFQEWWIDINYRNPAKRKEL